MTPAGNENNGVEHNGMSYTTGIIHTAASIDGMDDYIEVPSGDFSTLFSGSFTLSMWLYDSAPPADSVTNYSILYKAESSLLNSVWFYKDRQSGGYSFIAQDANATINSIAFSKPTVDGSGDNQWHHYVIMFNRNTLEKFAYKDGVLTSNGSLVSQTTITNSASLRIGIGQQLQHPWLGNIDDIRIYDRPLTENEVVALYDFNNQNNQTHWISLIDEQASIGTLSGMGNVGWHVYDIAASDRARVRIRAFDGVNYSDWAESGVFAINYQPTVVNSTVDGLETQPHAIQLPTFEWTFNPIVETDTQHAFQIQISETSDFGVTPLLDTTKIVSDQTVFSYADIPLTRGQAYYWRIKVWDSSDRESKWTSPMSFVVNSLPNVTFGSIAQAADGSGNVTVPVTLTDNDGDTVTVQSVEYTIDEGATFMPAAINCPLPTTSCSPVLWDTLTDGIGYETAQLRFILNDGFENSDGITSPSFVVDNNAPTVPMLTFPVGGESVSGIATITWNAATDSDQLESELVYEMEFTIDDGVNWLPEFDQADGISTTGGTGSYTWTLTNLSDTPNAKVRIRAFDDVNYTGWTESGRFTIDNTTPFIVTSPLTINEGDTSYDGRRIIVDGTTLTINGTHIFTSLEIINGGLLTHSSTTSTNEYHLDLNILTTLGIDASSRINASSLGYLPGYSLGNTTSGAAGGQSGGSYGGYGYSYSNTYSGNRNEVYGDFRNPNELGSGAARGGRGGGLIRITAGDMILDGSIRANGQSRLSSGLYEGGGSGGGIRLDVISLSGTGYIQANGGAGKYYSSGSRYNGGSGGGGRIAVYYDDISGFDTNRIYAYGGQNSQNYNGGAGTIFLKQNDLSAGLLKMANNNYTNTTITPIWFGDRGNPADDPATFELTFTISQRAVVRVEDTLTDIRMTELTMDLGTLEIDQVEANSVILRNSSVLGSLYTSTSQEHKLTINAQTVDIDASSRIDVSTRGYYPNRTLGNTTSGAAGGQSGGSYGGYGYSYSNTYSGNRNEVYGDFRNPNELGSGAARGGRGGGLIRITAGDMILDGSIRANGQSRLSSGLYEGGGSGGGIRLDVIRLSGTGYIQANGGAGKYYSSGSRYNGGSGGGGRIAVYYDDISGFDTNRIYAYGGQNSQNYNGGAGTIFLQQNGASTATMKLDNGNRTNSAVTPIWFGLRNDGNDDPDAFDLKLMADGDARYQFEGRTELRFTDLTIADSNFYYSGDGITANTITLSGVYMETPAITAQSMTLTDGSVLGSRYTTTSSEQKILIDVTGTITIDASSRIDVSTRGYYPNRTLGNTTSGAAGGQSGGSYGGYGYSYSNTYSGNRNEVYGDFRNPNELGSGAARGGRGGGLIRITAGDMILDGSIRANGQSRLSSGLYEGGGSGGGIRLDVIRLSGTGYIQANGGAGKYYSSGSRYNGGSGGGGRIAVYYDDISGFDTNRIYAYGGQNSQNYNGGAGTIFLQQNGASTATMKLDNGNRTNSAVTPIWFGLRNDGNDDPDAFDLKLMADGDARYQFEGRTELRFTDLTIADSNFYYSGDGITANTITLSGVYMETPAITAQSMTLTDGSVLGSRYTTTSSEQKILIDVTGTITIDASSRIDVSTRGYYPNRTLGNTTSGAAGGQSGGSYGGYGYSYSNTYSGNRNEVYGDFRNPNELGSGAARGRSRRWTHPHHRWRHDPRWQYPRQWPESTQQRPL